MVVTTYDTHSSIALSLVNKEYFYKIPASQLFIQIYPN